MGASDMSLKRKVVTIGGAWLAVSVVASAAMVRAIYTTLNELQPSDIPDLPEWEPATWHTTLEKVPPETWRAGDIVRRRETGEEVRVWGVGSDCDVFMADPHVGLLNTSDYILVRLKEEEA